VQLLLASENPKKLRELELLLGTLGIELRAPSSVGGLPELVEDQPTFAGNARLKARSGALAKGLWCLADDSGLEVDALNGQPGVLSARFAGTHGDDAANNALLLEKLARVPDPERGARFVCALCLCRPDGGVALEVEGAARGRILRQPRGRGDFGYDPLFLFTEQGFAQTGRAFAELEPSQKSAVSHRGRALREFLARLPGIRDLSS